MVAKLYSINHISPNFANEIELCFFFKCKLADKKNVIYYSCLNVKKILKAIEHFAYDLSVAEKNNNTGP